MYSLADKYKTFKSMSKLEILDELEEWHLLSAHYCVAWAVHSIDFAQEFNSVQLQAQETIGIQQPI